MYTALVLTEESQEQLKAITEKVYPDLNWELVCHHMTLHMGPASKEEQCLIGRQFFITLDRIGKSDKAAAATVDSVRSKEGINLSTAHIQIPHVTLMVNRKEGGKPFDSNKITEWFAYGEFRFVFETVFQEVV